MFDVSRIYSIESKVIARWHGINLSNFNAVVNLIKKNFDAVRVTLDTCGLELPSDNYKCLNNSFKLNDGVIGLITKYKKSGFSFWLGLQAMLMAPTLNDVKTNCE